MDDRRLYQTILGLEEPWRVAAVEVDAAAQEIRVHVEPSAVVSHICPECGRRNSQYVRSEQRCWRHLDTFSIERFWSHASRG